MADPDSDTIEVFELRALPVSGARGPPPPPARDGMFSGLGVVFVFVCGVDRWWVGVLKCVFVVSVEGWLVQASKWAGYI